MLLMILPALSGCGPIGDKAASIAIVYAVTTAASLSLLICYCCLLRKKDSWFLLLFSMVFIVNAGYLTLSVSRTLEEALLANRIAYLGSVFLPVAMLMITMDVCKLKYRKWFPGLLLCVGVFVLAVAASQGYLTIYYKEVSIETVNGVTVLNKVYGPWHSLYLFHLLAFFGAVIGVIIYASAKKKISSNKHAIILAVSVLTNLCVWLLEQMVSIDFEVLSISYIMTELFLLSIYLMLQDTGRLSPAPPAQEQAPVTAGSPPAPAEPLHNEPQPSPDQYKDFEAQIGSLTATERAIYDLYLSGKGTKEVMKQMNIKENTLKFHNKNIYGKLGVSSRKQLLEAAAALRASQNGDSASS